MSVTSGLLSEAFVKVESSYGTVATIASTNAIRVTDLLLTATNNREPSTQKRGSRGYIQSLSRRPTAEWSIPTSPLEPSGTMGTAGYFGPILKAGFGTETLPNLATTIASGAATTGAVLTSATGLTVGDVVFVTMSSGSREATRIKTIATNTVTWDALSGTPATPGAVVASVCYKISTSITESLSFFNYFTDTSGYKQAMTGGVVDTMEFVIDGMTEATFSASGPGKQLIVSGSVAAKPASHTTVGGMVSGLVGVVNYAGAVFGAQKCTIRLNNKLALRSNEIGTTYPSGLLPAGDFMDVTVSVEFWMEDTAIITAGQGSVLGSVRISLGSVNGAMLGFVLPSVEFEEPAIPGGVGGKTVTAEGRAYMTSSNDQLFIGM